MTTVEVFYDCSSRIRMRQKITYKIIFIKPCEMSLGYFLWESMWKTTWNGLWYNFLIYWNGTNNFQNNLSQKLPVLAAYHALFCVWRQWLCFTMSYRCIFMLPFSLLFLNLNILSNISHHINVNSYQCKLNVNWRYQIYTKKTSL